MSMRKIGIVTFALWESNVTPLCNLLGIINHLTDQALIITGNAGSNAVQKFKNFHFELIYHTSGLNAFTKAYNYVKTLSDIMVAAF